MSLSYLASVTDTLPHAVQNSVYLSGSLFLHTCRASGVLSQLQGGGRVRFLNYHCHYRYPLPGTSFITSTSTNATTRYPLPATRYPLLATTNTIPLNHCHLRRFWVKPASISNWSTDVVTGCSHDRLSCEGSLIKGRCASPKLPS